MQLADMFMVKIASRTRSDRLTNGRHCANVNAGSSFNLLHVGEARSNSDVTRFRAEDKVTKGVCADRWCFHCDKLWFDAVSKLPRFLLMPPERELDVGPNVRVYPFVANPRRRRSLSVHWVFDDYLAA